MDISSLPVRVGDIQDAHQRIEPFTVQTPVVSCEIINTMIGCEVHFKCENFQHIGAFKARGAMNAVLQLSEEEVERGVVTHSSGNHAAALARATSMQNLKSHIVMPKNTLPNKVAAVRRFGVEPTFCETNTESRESVTQEIISRTGAKLIHPFDDPKIIAGQGTVALELLNQVESLDAIVAPVGGGGLLSGCLIAIKSINPGIEVFAAEPKLADDAYRGWKSGKIEYPTNYDTIADGLRTNLGEYTFPIVASLVDDILLVEETEIIEATRILLECANLVAEPSGAVSLASVRKNKERFRGKNVGVVISGGNLDFSNLPWQVNLGRAE